ncbi:MAG: FG-GAP repeat protein, partial [Planctomycetes bacterium]|nr:FG-GAP repeat protein [Planctomycetota bacterium]
GKFLARDAETGDRLGQSSAIFGDYALVGAYSNDDAGDASGSAYVLRVTAADDCNENESPDECDIAAGTSLDLNENGVPDECECDTHADCDDGLDCTIDVCNPATHHCEYTIDPAYCLIDDTCFEDSTVNLEADCYFCDVGLDQGDWSVRPTGSPCGDPTALDCDLADTCDGLGWCLDNLADNWTPCSDEGNDCTNDVCAAGGCVHPFLASGAPCGDPSDTECTAPDTCDGLGACLNNHAENGAECSDGLFCDGSEFCMDGMCESFDPPCGDPGMACDEVVDLCYCYDLVACNGRYVDVNATGPTHDGSSWCQAYTSLQVALEAVVAAGGSIPELWVAQGTYRPSGRLYPDDPRSATFSLLNGLAIRGGFAGCNAPNPDRRDVTRYETVLTGELDDRGLRAYSVVTCSSTIETAVLDGFTVIRGSADTSFFASGGGMFGSWASPTLIDCYFHTNFASGYGGAVSLSNGHARLFNCRFAGNTAPIGGGAGQLGR